MTSPTGERPATADHRDATGGGPQPPIDDYAIVGDTRTAALVSSTGSVDWLCLPRFDSEPVFSRLIDADRGGWFELSVEGAGVVARRYRDSSAVLETTWATDGGEVTVTDGMALDVSSRLMPRTLFVRHVSCRGRSARVRLRFEPRAGFSGRPLRWHRRHGALIFPGTSLALSLLVPPGGSVRPGLDTVFELEPGHATFALALADREPLVLLDPVEARAELEAADRWWRSWSSRIQYGGPEPESVVRSLITLRLLTYSPSGAAVAAPTTSLPEIPDGGANWDYRYSWPRDAALGLGAFLGVDMAEEATSYLFWLWHATALTRPRLGVLHTLDGKPGPRERELPGVPGYRGNRPVRVGNEAVRQHQLDVYGWVLDAAALLHRAGHRLDAAAWRSLRSVADHAGRRWREPDSGIWESREPPAHHVHSKVMAWVSLDRGLELASSYRVPKSMLERWREQKRAIEADVRDRGFDEEVGSYVRRYGSRELDASLLLLPVVGFEPGDAPRMAGTVRAIRRELGAGEPLLYRHRDRPDVEEEGAFVACSFWLAQALVRSGDREQAARVFSETCRLANDVGLFAEEIDPRTHEHRGNFPQALAHAALVQAALDLAAQDG